MRRKRESGEGKGRKKKKREKRESRENEGTGCRRGQKGEMRGVGMSMRGWRTREREQGVKRGELEKREGKEEGKIEEKGVRKKK